jgi:hypothetical protein
VLGFERIIRDEDLHSLFLMFAFQFAFVLLVCLPVFLLTHVAWTFKNTGLLKFDRNYNLCTFSLAFVFILDYNRPEDETLLSFHSVLKDCVAFFICKSKGFFVCAIQRKYDIFSSVTRWLRYCAISRKSRGFDSR